MLNRLTDLIRLRPALDDAVQRVSPAGAADLSHLPVGTELLARVAAALPNRVYQVVIGERVYTLPLPIDARPGDELQLTVVERDPRAPASPPERPVQSGGGAVTILSPTARFITRLLNTPAQPVLEGASHTTVPLLPAPPAETAVVAARLSQALAESGIFYESHQAQWVAGERSLAQLMKEPQARIPPLPAADASPATADVLPAHLFAPVADPAHTAEAPVHPSLRPIVKEQLQTLSTLQLAWHGQVWPGQDLYWEIVEEAPQRHPGATEAASPWQTRLSLQLPRLGDVRAVVSISEAGVGVTLAGTNGAALDTMSANGEALRLALVKAGLRPASFRVDRTMVDRG